MYKTNRFKTGCVRSDIYLMQYFPPPYLSPPLPPSLPPARSLGTTTWPTWRLQRRKYQQVTPPMTSSPGEALRAGLRVWVFGFRLWSLGFRPRRRHQRSKNFSTPSLSHPPSLCISHSLSSSSLSPRSFILSLSLSLSLCLSPHPPPCALSL
jgi:hypothetical protein